MPSSRSSAGRLQYLDWVRGAAAITMLQGHVFDSFTRNNLRADGAFVYSQFLGGMPPAIFLLLTGVTFAFLMDSNERKGVAPRVRWATALKRSGYLFALAFAFRLQLWLFSPARALAGLVQSGHPQLHGVRHGGALADGAVPDHRADQAVRHPWPGDRLRLAADFAGGMALSPRTLRHYFVPDYRFFAFFPWGAFLAFGMSAGSMLRRIPEEGIERAMQWGAHRRRRHDSAEPVLLVAAVLDVFEIGLLAEQPGAGARQARRRNADSGVRLRVDPLRLGFRLELGAAVRHHVAAGLLGAHRAGVRPLVLALQEQPERPCNRSRGRFASS